MSKPRKVHKGIAGYAACGQTTSKRWHSHTTTTVAGIDKVTCKRCLNGHK